MSLMDWMAADRARVIVVPFDGVTPATPAQAIAISDEGTVAEENAWSPDGSTIYFVSEVDGYRCVYTQLARSAHETARGAADGRRAFPPGAQASHDHEREPAED